MASLRFYYITSSDAEYCQLGCSDQGGLPYLYDFSRSTTALKGSLAAFSLTYPFPIELPRPLQLTQRKAYENSQRDREP